MALERAAGELFREQGYACTSIVTITGRAGVSRETFFAYFTYKADLLWWSFDTTLAELAGMLGWCRGDDADEKVRVALTELAGSLPPENVVLAYVQLASERVEPELQCAASVRVGTVARVIAEYARGAGVEPLRAEVGGAAYGGSLIAAIGAWARAGAEEHALPEIFTSACEPLVGMLT